MKPPQSLADVARVGWEERAALVLLRMDTESMKTIVFEMLREAERIGGQPVSPGALGFIFGAAFGMGFALGEVEP